MKIIEENIKKRTEENIKKRTEENIKKRSKKNIKKRFKENTVEVTQEVGIVPRRRHAVIRIPFKSPQTIHRETLGVFYSLPPQVGGGENKFLIRKLVM